MHELNLITGNRSSSHNSLTPWLLLKEFQIPFHEIRIDLYRPDAIERLGLYSPSLQVPVLIHEDIKVWDALPICEYISETFLEQRGWPRHLKKRAAARSICAELHADFAWFRERWPMDCNLMQTRVPDARLEREIARLDAILYCCRGKHGDGGPWLFGNFSIADAFMAPFAIALHGYGAELSFLSREYVDTLLQHPEVLCWQHDAHLEHHKDLYAMTG
jgi:glutathione S-transferase